MTTLKNMETETHELSIWGGGTLAYCAIAALATRSEILAGLAGIAVVFTLAALWLERR